MGVSLQEAVAELHGVPISNVLPAETTYDRFTYWVVRLADGNKAFVKASDKRPLKEALLREAHAAGMCQRLGMPTIQPLAMRDGESYGEYNGVGVSSSLYLPPTTWRVVQHEEIANLSVEDARDLAQKAAHASCVIPGYRVPTDANIGLLLHGVGAPLRFLNAQLLNAHWQLCEPVFTHLSNICVTGIDERVNWLREQVEQAQEAIYRFDAFPDNGLYLMHGDLAINNIARSRTSGVSFQVLDLEYFAVSRCEKLARMCDMANLFGRAWPNQALQEAYLQELKRMLVLKDELVPFLHAMVLMGSLNLARFAIHSPSHPEFLMAKALIERLPRNLVIARE